MDLKVLQKKTSGKALCQEMKDEDWMIKDESDVG